MKGVRMFWQVTRWARAARFWLFLLLAVGAWAGFGGAKAHAQDYSGCFDASVTGNALCANRGDAYQAVRQIADQLNQAPDTHPSVCIGPIAWSSGRYYYQCTYRAGTTKSVSRHWPVGQDCPLPKVWREDLGRCFDPDECQGRNGAQNGMPLDPVVKTFRERCVSGCELKMQAGTGGCTVLGGPGSGAMNCNGVFQYTGEQCSVPPGENPTPDPEEPKGELCSSRDGGQIKVCKKADGRECYEATGGAMICWGVGETGQRSEGDTAQTRGPGTEAPTPTPPTPPETFDPTKTKGPETTTTTTTNPDGSTRTITTTVINNTTTNGTNAPGTPGSTPPQSGGDNDGDEDEGSATGGGDCDSPPIVTGDAVLGMVATQAWATRCAVEAGNTAAVTGDVGDCKSPFSVQGDNANAEQLKALRAKICNDEARIEGDVEGMQSMAIAADGEIAEMESEFGESAFGEGSGLGSISLGRFGGGGGCPTISVSIPMIGKTWTPPPEFCSAIAALRLLFLAVATIWALRILGSE